MQSAGNFNEGIEKISDHLESKRFLLDHDDNFGSYLAGYLEANGRIIEKKIEMDIKDVKLGNWLKKRIGYGRIEINNDMLKLVVDHPLGIKHILKITNGKFYTLFFDTSLLLNDFFKLPLKSPKDIKLDHYLTGFLETIGGFVLLKENEKEITIFFAIEHHNTDLLSILLEQFGGQLGYTEDKKNLYFTSEKRIIKEIIDYLDNYTFNSSTFIHYLKWRDAYRILQNNEHLTKKGFDKLLAIFEFFQS